ncbi:hypothetical protein IWQ57_005627, partial [Coemansia nantahalensis]
IVIALDSDQLLSTGPAEAGGEADMGGWFWCFKTVAWAKANIIRAHEDHVFLVTSVETASRQVVDGTTLTMMWNSMVNDVDAHRDRQREADEALRRLAEALGRLGVSTTAEVAAGAPAETIPQLVRAHKGELLVVQAPTRSAIAATLWYSWADRCAHTAACPTVVVKESDLPDNVAVALDPPAPAPEQQQQQHE